ncbi:MAG: acyl-CoA dehydrogenase family protein, partial [Pseudomonadota bacterium]
MDASHIIAEDSRAIARDLAERRFAGRAARWDRERAYCWDNVADLAEAGLMGMTIPRAHGGRG